MRLVRMKLSWTSVLLNAVYSLASISCLIEDEKEDVDVKKPSLRISKFCVGFS